MTPDLELDLCDSEWSLTKKLRIEDPEQFHTLVRMHLSFVLDLNTDETDSSIEEKSKLRPFKWSFTSFSKKTKNSKGLVEGDGVPLTEDLISQINQLVDFVSIEENICQEGIFRKSGSTSRQQELKSLLGHSNSIELASGQFSVHDCASVLKCYLAELPEPVLTELYYPAYCQISELCFDSDQPHTRLLRSIQLLLLLLPLDNYNLFKKLITLLHLTASHASENRMSSQNLATLFTPHLLCPRKLSPESLHTSAAVLSKILVFMIDNGNEIFLVPDTLATDVKAYWAKKERKLKSPVKDPINDSIMDSSAVNTVFTFVDREKTAQENTENATEAALAQLYAYIQALPESSKKRRLVKQFNKENGHGTPAVVAKQTPGPVHSSGKHFGDSIKKHIFSKGLRNKLNNQMNSKAKTKLLLDNLSHGGPPSTPLGGTDTRRTRRRSSELIPPSLKPGGPGGSSMFPPRTMPDLSRLYNDEWDEESDDEEMASPFFATPTPGSRLVETMLTPRSRKPVVALSGTNLCHLAAFDSPLTLPSSNDDLLTATVDLTFTHDSLSDSMIKTLEEDTPDLSETEDGVAEHNILDKKTEEEKFFNEKHFEEKNRLVSSCSVRSGNVGRSLAFSPVVSNGRKSVEIGGAVFDSYSGSDRTDLRKGNLDSDMKWDRQSGSSLRENSGTALNWGSESGNCLRENSGTDMKLAKQSGSELYNRPHSHVYNNQNQHEHYSMGTNSSSTIDSKNPVARNSLNMDTTDGGCGNQDTPPAASRKRSSQNNNNDESEVKKCLRENNSKPSRVLSETAL
uniref:Rho GTPase-activating protein 19 n=1 Tax=Cacopsylla melanoneura TaxID=428564 RepID=A0A8D8VRZ1_9HEMI